MNLELSEKRALVTGSTAGIGYAIAHRLAAEGAEVVLNGRDAGRVEAACARLRADLPQARVRGVAADVSSSEGVAALITACGEADIVVNNFGIFEPCAFEDISDADWQRFFDANVMSGVRLARHYLPRMKAQDWGRIVFISSESGLNPPGDMVHYGMSKSAQLSVSRGMAETCGGTGVTVNAVLPGPTRTEGVVEFFAKLAIDKGLAVDAVEQAFFKHDRPSSLLQRFIEPAEVANLVAYVCSPLASATNGAALRVDGGVVRSIS
jgi:NAD(P)-dependent dehydrogenase (short-subunit alcohol dehydrogenase family)